MQKRLLMLCQRSNKTCPVTTLKNRMRNCYTDRMICHSELGIPGFRYRFGSFRGARNLTPTAGRLPSSISVHADFQLSRIHLQSSTPHRPDAVPICILLQGAARMMRSGGGGGVRGRPIGRPRLTPETRAHAVKSPGGALLCMQIRRLAGEVEG
jgi:hypothetical protein